MQVQKSGFPFLNQAPDPNLDPGWGYFSPGSPVWVANRERINILGGLRAILMQLAHPKIAQGVADHSNFDRDPLGRFFRTMHVVKTIIFEDRLKARQTASKVFKIHARVQGTVSETGILHGEDPFYAGTDPQLLMWVYATLIDSLMFIQKTLIAEKERFPWDSFYRQGKTFGHLFGIPPGALPPTLADFNAYLAGMLTNIEVSETGKRMAARLLALPHPIFMLPNRIWAAGTLPASLRRQYDLAWNSRSETVYRTTIWAARMLYRTTPEALKVSKKVRAAEKRYSESQRPLV